MKTKQLLAFAFLSLLLLVASGALAAESIPITEIYFTDEIFRSYILEHCDTGGGDLENVSGRDSGDKILSPNEIASVTSINLNSEKYRGIKTLDGIQYFTNLDVLNCANLQLTGLKLSLSSLNRLTCSGNAKMTMLDVSECTNLNYLSCSNCALEGTLDLSKLYSLNSLSCSNNPELSIIFPKSLNPDNSNTYMGIAEVFCSNIKAVGPATLSTEGGKLINIFGTDVLGGNLKTFYCHDLTGGGPDAIDFSQATIRMSSVYIQGNPNLSKIVWDEETGGVPYAAVSYLDISGTNLPINSTIATLTSKGASLYEFKAASMVWAGSGTADVSALDDLWTLDLSGNGLTEIILPATANSWGLNLNLQDNAVTGLNAIPSWTKSLNLSGNKLTSLPEIPASVTELDISNNEFTFMPTIPENVTWLNIAGNKLTERGTLHSGIYYLDISSNDLAALNVSDLVSLDKLYAGRNNLVTMDLSANSVLRVIDVEYNKDMTTLTLPQIMAEGVTVSYVNISGTKIPLSVVPKTVRNFYADAMGYELGNVDLSEYTKCSWIHFSDNGTGLTGLILPDWEDNYTGELLARNNALTSIVIEGYAPFYRLDLSGNRMPALDLSKCKELEVASCDEQIVDVAASGFSPSGSGWQLAMSGIVGSDGIANVENVQGYGSDGAAITTSYSNGIASFSAFPSKVTYSYKTGGRLYVFDWTTFTGGLSDEEITMSVTLNINGSPVIAPVLSMSSQLWDLTEGTAASALTIEAVSGNDLSWSTSGNLPAGLTGEGSGNSFTISGTPSAGTAGSYTYTVTASNSSGSASAVITISITAPAVTPEPETEPETPTQSPDVSPDVPVPPVSPDVSPDVPVPPVSPDVSPDMPVPPTSPDVNPDEPVSPTSPDVNPDEPVSPTSSDVTTDAPEAVQPDTPRIDLQDSEIVQTIQNALQQILGTTAGEVEIVQLPEASAGTNREELSEEELAQIPESEDVAVILPVMVVDNAAVYVFGVKVTLPVGTAINLHMMAERSGVTGSAVFDAATSESDAYTFLDDDGNEIDRVPANQHINIAAYMEPGYTYAPVITKSASSSGNSGDSGNSGNSGGDSGNSGNSDTNTHALGSSGGGCNSSFTGMLLFWLVLAEILGRMFSVREK